MTMHLTHIPDRGSYPTPPLSSGTRAGNLVFVSGTPGFHADGSLDANFGLQFDNAVDEIARVMREAGGTLADLAKVNVLLTRVGDLEEMNRRYALAFGPAPYPARTTSVVAALPHPQMLLEIEALAVLGDSRS